MKRKCMRIGAVLLLTVCLVMSMTGCQGKTPEKVSEEGYYLDTVCTITIYDMKDMSQDKASATIKKAYKECQKYEELLSKTKESSDVYKINHAGGKRVTCDPITVSILKKGIKYGDMTGGLFDITVGKAEDLYNFHAEDEKDRKVPTEAELAKATSHINYKNIHIDGNEVWLDDPECEIDLGGIAKGYIGDRLGDYLADNGVSDAVISLGGNIICVGDKGGEGFLVGIQKPFSDNGEIIGTTEAKDQTLVTSGIYERYFKKNGKVYHHILNPKTGLPQTTDVYGVTIVAKDGKSEDCDAMATICLLFGKDKGMEFIKQQKGYEALFVDAEDNVTKTEGFSFEEQGEE